MYKYQFLLCAEQLSNQKIRSFVSRFFLVKLRNVLATSAADRPLTPSCQSTPVALSFPFFDAPTGANVSLNTTILLQKTATFNPGSLGNMITFCISTDTNFSLSVHSRFFSSRYPVLFDCCFNIKLKINTIIHVRLICEYLLSVFRECCIFHTPLLQAYKGDIHFFTLL